MPKGIKGAKGVKASTVGQRLFAGGSAIAVGAAAGSKRGLAESGQKQDRPSGYQQPMAHGPAKKK